MIRRNFIQSLCAIPSLPFISWFIPHKKEKVEDKTIITQDCLYVFTDNDELISLYKKMKSYGYSQVGSIKVYNYVKDYVDVNKEKYDYLLNNGPQKGCIYYWEENHHDKIVRELVEASGFEGIEISRALSSLGM